MTREDASPLPDDPLADLAHELRTPLAIITGYAELLKHRDDEKTRRQAAEQIGAAAERLTNVIDELLAAYADGSAGAPRDVGAASPDEGDAD